MKNDIVYEITDYARGYYQDQDHFHCLYCEAGFEDGLIYPSETATGPWKTAEKAMQQHLQQVHQGPLFALLQQNREISGLTEIQQTILNLFAQRLSDTVIAQRLGISSSTVRNHRFKLREKERQARVFLSMMNLLESEDYLPPHIGAKMVDERYQITASEKATIIANYFTEGGRLRQFPSKEKRKIIVLGEIAKQFEPAKNYSEKAVNEILKRFIADFVTLRRYLIEYGFMQRTKDGKTYWVVTA